MIRLASTSTIEIKCEKCNNPYETEVIDHVDLSEDRELIKSLRMGKANRAQCPKCKKVMYIDRSIVVNFDPESLIVLYDPNAKSKAVKDTIMSDYQSVISFNEILQETGEDTEFSIISDLKKLKKLLDDYDKAHK
ncbi:hypothetical protein EU527_00995 [Candidatus Thorarchaeota archaeon]|nr:MAG: hypothetical protein EU527_00995 [Candidatus Thorarchaeota archaeon]